MKNALINIGISRPTKNVNFSLPSVLFNGNDFNSGYVQSLKGLIPFGVENLGAVNDAVNGNIEFRFRDTATFLIDKLIVFCNEIPMTTLVQNTISKKIKINEILYQLDDTSLINAQYSQNIQLIESGIFGKKVNDSFTPNQYRSDMVKINDSITLPLNLEIGSNNGLIVFMTSKSPFVLNLSLNISY